MGKKGTLKKTEDDWRSFLTFESRHAGKVEDLGAVKTDREQ